MNKTNEKIYSQLIKDEFGRLKLRVDFEIMQLKIEDLQQRIDKAIEYIKSTNYVKKAWKLGGVEKTNEDILLEILGGSNENN